MTTAQPVSTAGGADTTAELALPTRSRRPAALFVAAAVVLVVLAVVALGAAGTLVLGGGFLLAAGIGRSVPGLDGPASWAGAVVVEVALIAGLSAVLAVLSPTLHGTVPHVAILLAPVLVGLALLGLSRRFGRPAPSTPQAAVLAAAITGLALAGATWVATRGAAYGVTWAMSGDARNHVFAMRSILIHGGLAIEQLRSAPVLIDAVAAVVSGAGGRSGLPPGALMLHDAHAMATTYLLALVATGVLLVAAVLEGVPSLAERRRLPVSVVLTLVMCAATAASPLVLGTALLDGFLTAYGTIPLALAAIILALRVCGRPSPVAYALLGPATVLVLFGWTILAVVPAAAIIVATVVALRYPVQRLLRERRIDLAWALAPVLPVAAVLLVVGITFTQWETLKAAFLLPGAITPPDPQLLLLAFLATAGLAFARTGADRARMLVPVAAALAGYAVIRVLRMLPEGPPIWTYYAYKTLWLVVCCLVWVPFVPIVRAVSAESAAGRAATVVGWVRGLALGAAVLVVLGVGTPTAEPVEKASDGWYQPTASIISRTAKAGDHGGNFLLWEWADPGTDRLANFWTGAIWGTNAAGQITQPDVVSWAYGSTGVLTDVCTMATASPGLRVITHSPTLQSRLDEACPGIDVRVHVDGT